MDIAKNVLCLNERNKNERFRCYLFNRFDCIGDISDMQGGGGMKIERTRYVVMRNNRTEIWCGLAQHYHFVKVDEIKDVAIKTYRTRKQAESGCSSWDRDFEVVECKEIYDIG